MIVVGRNSSCLRTGGGSAAPGGAIGYIVVVGRAVLGSVFVTGLLAVHLNGCGVDERSDFLVGRRCTPGEGHCDPGQACLAHVWRGGLTFTDYRCRDEASLLPIDAPLAYCNENEPCPGSLICNADRVRIDAAIRPLVCNDPDDFFSPPADAGM